MDLRAVIKDLEGCPCGRKHHFDLETYEADRGLVHKVGEILTKGNFPKKIYIVSDETAMRVSEGLLASLDATGFTYETKVYPDMRYAYLATSREIMEAAKDFDGILSIGTGSVNDVCRYAAAQTNKAFAIFATALFSRHEILDTFLSAASSTNLLGGFKPKSKIRSQTLGLILT